MENIIRLEHEIAEIKAHQAASDEQHKTIFRRLDKQDEMIESVQKLASSVERLTLKQESTQKKVDSLCEDMDEIKAKPAKRWEEIVRNAICTVVGALVMYVLTRLGLG